MYSQRRATRRRGHKIEFFLERFRLTPGHIQLASPTYLNFYLTPSLIATGILLKKLAAK